MAGRRRKASIRRTPPQTNVTDTDTDTPSTSTQTVPKRPAVKRKLPARKCKAKQARNGEPEVKEDVHTGHFSQLPCEVLAEILEYLSIPDLIKVESVNRRCYNVARNLVWSRITVLDHDALRKGTKYPKLDIPNTRFYMRRYFIYKKPRMMINDAFVKLFVSRTKLTKLDLACHWDNVTYKIAPFLSMAPRLKHIDLSLVQLNNKSLRTIARYCPLLEIVIFEQCFTTTRVESGLSVFFGKLKHLKVLNLSENNKLQGDALLDVPLGLKYLSISNSYNIPPTIIDQLSFRLPNLEGLIIDNHDTIRAEHVNLWCTRFTKLRLLEVSNICNQQGDHPALDFQHLKDLEMLTGVYNPAFKASTFRSLRQCSNLRSLDMTFSRWMTAACIEELCHLKQLKCLNLFHSNLTVNIQPLLTEMNLEYINLSDCHEFNPELVGDGLYASKTLRLCDLVSPLNLYKNMFIYCWNKYPIKKGSEMTVIVDKMTNLRKVPQWMNAERYGEPSEHAAYTNTRDWRKLFE